MLDVAAMAAHLPADSATARAIRPPEPDDVWTLENQLLAAVADLTGGLLAISKAQFAGKRRVDMPDPIPRPGVTPTRETLDADLFDSSSDFIDWYSQQPGGRPLAA